MKKKEKKSTIIPSAVLSSYDVAIFYCFRELCKYLTIHWSI